MVSYGIAEVASLQRGLPLRAKEPAVRGRPSLNWWRERFGFGSDCLTRSEARYLENLRMLKPFEIDLLRQDLKSAPLRLRAPRRR
jgi:hypothetical protein